MDGVKLRFLSFHKLG